MSTLALQGTIADLPSGAVFRAFDVRVPCVPAPAMRVIELTADPAFVVNLDGLAEVHVLYVESDQPVTVEVTSDAGVSQSIPLESMFVVSRAVPITAIALVRVAGQATTVRLILGQEA